LTLRTRPCRAGFGSKLRPAKIVDLFYCCEYVFSAAEIDSPFWLTPQSSGKNSAIEFQTTLRFLRYRLRCVLTKEFRQRSLSSPQDLLPEQSLSHLIILLAREIDPAPAPSFSRVGWNRRGCARPPTPNLRVVLAHQIRDAVRHIIEPVVPGIGAVMPDPRVFESSNFDNRRQAPLDLLLYSVLRDNPLPPWRP